MPSDFTKPVSDAEVSGLASVAGKLPLSGGTLTGNLLGNGIRVGPATSDGSDNSLITLGHSGNSRGGGISCYGNEHVTFPGMVRADVGGTGLFRVYQATSILFQVDGNSGNTSSSFQHSCGGLSSSAPLQLTGTQTSAGASVANIYRDSGGNLWNNVASGFSVVISVGNQQQLSFGSYGVSFAGNQTAYSNSTVCNYRDSSGNLNSNVATGAAHIARVNGSSLVQVDNTGIVLTANHTPPANNAYGLWREGAFAQTVLQGPDNGAVTLYCPISGTPGTVIKAHGASDTNRPACISMRSAGKNYTNTGTWVNFYSLAEGTHNGQFRLYCNGYNNYYVFTINGTTLTELYNGWTVGNVTGSPTSSQIGFRVSGGWIQINVGTALSSTLYFTATYEGIVR